MARQRHGRARISIAVCAALVLHLQVVTVGWIWDRLHPSEQANEIDVEYVPVTEAELDEADLPPEKIELPPPAELAQPQPVPEAAEAAKPAEPQPAAPPPPAEAAQDRRKMVEQHYDKDEPDNPNARFLGAKNKHVTEETRARETNLERESRGTPGSSPSQNQSPEPGDEDHKIAELEDRKSAKGKQAPKVTPHRDEELPKQAADKSSSSLLSMRSPGPTPKAGEQAEVSPDGTQPAPEDQGASSGPAQSGRVAGSGERLKLNLTGEDYDKIFGRTEGAERQLGETERSRKPGRWQQRWGAIQSALENFVPEVKPGNQTELGTRASPFAAFVAQMHRSIHKGWGFGVLEEWDHKESSNPFSNLELWTMLEIVLKGDGTIDKVTIVRPSGYLPFDVAAMDVVMSGAPYPDPPANIKSANGKIYLHWRFHRDERACGTFGVDPYILSTPPADTIAGNRTEVAMPRGGGEGAARPAALPRMPGQRSAGLDRSFFRDDERVPAAPAPPASPPRAQAPSLPRPNDPAARAAAEQWLAAYLRRDAAGLAAASALPFRSGGRVAAKGERELVRLYQSLLTEASGHREVERLALYAAAQFRSHRGRLPRSGTEGAGELYAIGRVGGEELILVLAQRGSSWKVVGLDR